MNLKTNETQHISCDRFMLWIASAQPGDRLVYCDGYLGRDRQLPRNSELDGLGDVVWGHRKIVQLSQRRLGFCRWEYIATKLPSAKVKDTKARFLLAA